MTRKEFKEQANIQNYGSRRNPDCLTAIFFEWKSNDEGNGFKYCIFSRNSNATTDELLKMLQDFIELRIEDVPWFVQLIVAQTDKQRFKIPLQSSGLNKMIKYELQTAKV